jgi:hypothetical protein
VILWRAGTAFRLLQEGVQRWRGKQEEDDESPRPKKRRKAHAPGSQQDGARAERRSTQSQSRRDAMQASQEIAEEHIVDDAGSEYEE